MIHADGREVPDLSTTDLKPIVKVECEIVDLTRLADQWL